MQSSTLSPLSPLKVDSGVISDRDVNITANLNSSHPNAQSTVFGVAHGSSASPEQSDVLQARLTVSVLCFLLSVTVDAPIRLVRVSSYACHTHTHDTDNQSDIENSKIWMRWFSSWLSSQSCAALKSENEYDLPDSSANIRRVIHPRRKVKGEGRLSKSRVDVQ